MFLLLAIMAAACLGLTILVAVLLSSPHSLSADTEVWRNRTLIKTKIKFSSYKRKLRMEQLQSHIWLTASSYKRKYLRISSYIRKPFLIYTLQLLHSEFPHIWGKFHFLFYQCRERDYWVLRHNGGFCNICILKRCLQRKVDFKRNVSEHLPLQSRMVTKELRYFIPFWSTQTRCNWMTVTKPFLINYPPFWRESIKEQSHLKTELFSYASVVKWGVVHWSMTHSFRERWLQDPPLCSCTRLLSYCREYHREV